MKTNTLVSGSITDDDIMKQGMMVLQRELGTTNAMRFLLLFDKGRGNYTEERHLWLDQLSMDDILVQLQTMRGEA